MKNKKTTLARTRVQGIVFFGHYFDFRRGFIGCFESTTKVQRECQKCTLEGQQIDPEGKLLWFSKVTRKKYYKNRYFGARAANSMQPALEPQRECHFFVSHIPAAAGSVFFANIAPNASGTRGHAINLVKQSV